MNIQTCKGVKPEKEKRIKNSGQTTSYGENGGDTVPTKQYKANYDNIDWSKK